MWSYRLPAEKLRRSSLRIPPAISNSITLRKRTTTADGYQPATREVHLRYGDQLFVTIRLTPVGHKVKRHHGAVTSVNNLKVLHLAEQEYIKGNRAFKAQRFSAAKKYFEQAVKEYLCYAQAQLGLATVQIEEKHAPQAKATLKFDSLRAHLFRRIRGVEPAPQCAKA